jgi:hypothetical protein
VVNCADVLDGAGVPIDGGCVAVNYILPASPEVLRDCKSLEKILVGATQVFQKEICMILADLFCQMY